MSIKVQVLKRICCDFCENDMSDVPPHLTPKPKLGDSRFVMSKYGWVSKLNSVFRVEDYCPECAELAKGLR